ncbi:nucleotidyltransferase family protein [Vibrio sp. SCSIO 43137]|uniref:nucleotidyltransferase family protein n=1 Tax=Vibrio sp. SCSIO 43137 TaxID=3021011 RepID=UPI002306FD6B|nr:nucleotidyltransferase family protein [Vibrio sp. SCSIO 43137]WCE30762.1 nucleotidyltransferase family protein [Vibrio sp. SCSIO 43137]
MAKEDTYQTTIIHLVSQDKLRSQALEVVRQLSLPDCYIGAGFVRNLVWDYLHSRQSATNLNDVDVVYFDRQEQNPQQYLLYEQQLKQLMPQLNWQVRNQALMHVRNGDKPYSSTLDALSYWPEKETAVAIRLSDEKQIECIAAYGFDSLFQGHITYNPKRSREVFQQRVDTKGWLEKWPKLEVRY